VSSRWPCLTSRGPRAEIARLQLAVVPGARRTGADGLHDGALRVRLVAPAVEGKANAALLAWLADELDLPRRALQIERGETARRKTVAIDAPVETVAAWLDRVLDEAER
jgi:hypothetical protein